MPTRPDQFPMIARKQAKSPDVVRLFDKLARRAKVFARMQDEFTESVTRHRAERQGRPVRLTSRQQRMLAGFEGDADQAVQDMVRCTPNLDDAALLTTALSGAQQQIQLDEHMIPGFHDDDKPMAARLLDYQRETMSSIEKFIAASAFKGQVRSIWHDKRIINRA